MGRLSEAKWCLLGCLIVVLVLVAGSVFIPARLTNAVRQVASSDFASDLRAFSRHEEVPEDKLIEMIVETVGVSKNDYQPVVILKEKDGELYLPIWVGLVEANAISVVLEGVEVPRPLTPDLLCSIINEVGASVDYIIINDLQDQTFYANISLNAGWMRMEIDARPSDAIAIAIRVGAPICVEKAVLDKAGVLLDQETPKYTTIYGEQDKT